MISVPGKIFIFGEYSVMSGGEAILVTVSPHFECFESENDDIHVDSPAGRFGDENQAKKLPQVEEGLGKGFGSSTAELIAVNELLPEPWEERRLWSWYRKNCFPASGADLAVQNRSRIEGNGFYHFQLHDDDFRLNRIEVPAALKLSYYLFQAAPAQKIPTHQDLKKKNLSIDLKRADFLIHQWLGSFDSAIFTQWASFLSSCGFESEFARAVRESFEDVPGVTGVKGCGAGLNDVYIVCASPHSKLDLVARKFNLSALGTLNNHV